MAEPTASTLQSILEACRDGSDGIGFNEVVVMLESTAASAEVYMDFDDLRFTPDGRIVTLMVPGGTHMHLDMSKIREAEFIHTTNDQGLPSYQLWMRDGDGNPAMRSTCASPTTTPPTHRATSSSWRCSTSTPTKSPCPPLSLATTAGIRKERLPG